MRNALTIACLVMVFAGCAAAPAVPVTAIAAQELWRDHAFSYDTALVLANKQDLFALDTALLATLHASGMKGANTQQRVDYLIALLFGPDRKSFPYAGGQSTIGAVTWRTGRGDCLSLTVLAYSIARELNLTVQLQEVSVPQFYDRHGSLDFVQGHINLLVKNDARQHPASGATLSSSVVIDFEPQAGWLRAGTALSEESILARYYNNIAAEHFAKDNLILAYAWFKAAILADANYAPGYSNLAQLYKRKGFVDSAERLLLHAIALNRDDGIAVHSMHQLLTAQGREAEAKKYALILQAQREKNPYYWLDIGRNFLREERYAKAVGALEHAETLTAGFDEVHRNLAIAYWRIGDIANAKKQLGVLASLIAPDKADASFAALSRKITNVPLN